MFIEYFNSSLINLFYAFLFLFFVFTCSFLLKYEDDNEVSIIFIFRNFSFILFILCIFAIVFSLFKIIIFNSYTIYFLFLIALIIFFKKKNSIYFFFKKYFKLIIYYKYLSFILFLLFINSLLPILDSDSYLYHLAYPYRLIINNFNYINESWFHTNLILYAEIINLISVSFKSDNFVSILNFIFLLFIILFLIDKKLSQGLIFIISSPLIYFFIISQKFFFAPLVILFYFFIKIINLEKINYIDYSIFLFSILSKFTFMVYLPFFFILHILNDFTLRHVLKIIIRYSIFLFIVGSPIFLFRINFISEPFFPFYYDNELLHLWYLDMRNFMVPSLYNFTNILLPLTFDSIRSFLGVFFIFIFLTFIILFYKKKYNHLIPLIILIILSLLFLQTSSRFYYFLSIISFFYFLIFYENRYFFNFFNILKSLAIFQSFFLLIILFTSLYLFKSTFLDLNSNHNKHKIFLRYATDYNYMNDLELFKNENNFKNINSILISRSNIFFNDNFMSVEMFDYVNRDLEKNINTLKNYMIENDINYIFGPATYVKNLINNKCIKSKLIHTVDDLSRYSRNPLKSEQLIFSLYEIRFNKFC